MQTEDADAAVAPACWRADDPQPECHPVGVVADKQVAARVRRDPNANDVSGLNACVLASVDEPSRGGFQHQRDVGEIVVRAVTSTSIVPGPGTLTPKPIAPFA